MTAQQTKTVPVRGASAGIIALAGLLAGTLDALSAIIRASVIRGVPVGRIFQYISSALLGKSSYEGGGGTIALGIFLHYFIAFTWTIIFFAVYPKLKIPSRFKYITALVYGLIVWTIMNLVVVPLSRIHRFPTHPDDMAIEAIILILAIGLPLSLIANAGDRERI